MLYDKLVRFYRKYNLVPSALSDEELAKYFSLMEERENLIVDADTFGEITGFIECWRINYEQLGRILVHGLIDARKENTTDGNIAFLANLAIRPDLQGTEIGNILRNYFFILNYNCGYFCGDSRRRIHHHTFNIYKRNEIMSKYLKNAEVSNG